MTLKTERKRKIGRKTGRSNNRLITRSLSSTSPKKTRHRIRWERLWFRWRRRWRAYRRLRIDFQMGNKSLGTCLTFLSRKGLRKDRIKVLHFLLEEILHSERKMRRDKQMDGDDDFFLIENMETSEFTVLDLEKTTSIQKVLKVDRTKKCWTPIRHIFIKTLSNDEDNASDADSSIPQNPIRLLSCCRSPNQKRSSQTQIRRPIRRPRILISRLLLWKKKDQNSRSTKVWAVLKSGV